MKTIFADTFYWVALINNRDDWHEKAIEMTRKLQQVTREHLTCAMSINAYSSQKLENLEPDHKEK